MTTASPRSSGLHHLELWTADLAAAEPAWDWLLTALGWRRERVEGWELGRIWRHADDSYLVLEQSEDVLGARAERRSPGMNHLALRVAGRAMLDEIRAGAARHGWKELFAARYPHAGGEDHVAWYGEDPHGIEVELVAAG
ncbi:MAG: VOC family protein [Dermabacteraceae bacterium]|uniref:VOC family protein n=1 Tax=Brachybacterium sp. TaxID=1891286 RepID=UPI002653C9BE|nr:VOC family protein [Brachybacterium sp.]MDN6329606.1 VOC family protein [Brachybacterium sp.]